MNKIIYAFAVASIVLTSCQSETTAENQNAFDVAVEQVEVNISKFEELAVEPCNLLTEEMVTSLYDVKAEVLKLSKYSSKKGKISWTAYCTYSWKKPNFNEIQKRTQEKMLEAMKSGNTKNAMSIAMEVEKASFEVGITNLKIYNDTEKAMKAFIQSHTVPESKDVDKLNEAIDAESTDKLTKDGKEVGKEMVGEIAANLKFEKIEGIGTSAYWDYLGNKLDVLYGTIQIGIIMHISEKYEENVAAAKKLAEEIMSDF